MCIVCNQKEALKVVEQGFELMAGALAEMLNIIERVKGTGFVLGDAEERARVAAALLLSGDLDTEAQPDMFAASQQAPAGVPADIWAAMPDEVRGLLLDAQSKGANVQVIKLSDIISEPETKH